MATAAPPSWAARIVYGERFHVEPHQVNPPLLWWYRLGAWDEARADRRAREDVEQSGGLERVDAATRERHGRLMIRLKTNDV